MKKYQANSIGDLFYHKLVANSFEFTGVIHSIFANVINFQWDGELYTIGKAKIGNGPYTVLLPILSEDLNLWRLEPGEQVRGDQQGIFLGNRVWIDIRELDIWESDWEICPQIDMNSIRTLIPWIRELIIREGDLTGVGMLVEIWQDYSLSPDLRRGDLKYRQKMVLREAAHAIKFLRQGIWQNRELFTTGIIKLVGLGPGLTPAGDDFLIGFLMTFQYLDTGSLIKGFRKKFLIDPGIDSAEFTEILRDSTNLISAKGVRAAILGRPSQLVREVIQNIFAGRRIETTLSVLRLIDRGITSGTDILTGIVVGCDWFLELNQDLQLSVEL